MIKPILSICIPTYNRAECLQQCLETITSQYTNDEPLIQSTQIVISNNGSTDTTDSVVQEYLQKYPNIIYHRNEKNLGFDRNILLAVEKSTGTYCLTLGDDDGLMPGSLRKLCTKLESSSVPYFILNSYGYDHELKKQIMQNPNRLIQTDITYPTLHEFVKTIHGFSNLVGTFGGMSVQLFKRKPWSAFPNKSDFVDTQAVHLFILLQVFKEHQVTLVAEPFVKTRNDNMRWDICPGFETASKRVGETVKIALWISNLYQLGLSSRKVKASSVLQIYVLTAKSLVKKGLILTGLRKK